MQTQQLVSERDAKVLAATLSELIVLPELTNTYTAVGKMFLKQELVSVKNELQKKKEGCEKEAISFQRASGKLEGDLNDVKSLMKDIISSAKINE